MQLSLPALQVTTLAVYLFAYPLITNCYVEPFEYRQLDGRAVVQQLTLQQIEGVVLGLAKDISAIPIPMNSEGTSGQRWAGRHIVVEGGAALVKHFPDYRPTKVREYK
jgi:hypothetical protein